MGSKKERRRYFIVNYNIKPNGKFDEFVELSKKKIGTGKFAKATVILDCVNQEVLKCTLPGTEGLNIPYENLYKHYEKWYADVLQQFINS